jgi:hypothetical protein
MLPDASEYVNEFFGLPAHPLIVHAVVVLLPLCAIALILMAVVGKWRRKYSWVVLTGLFLSVIFAYLAKESGESLATVVGNPERHANLGEWMPFIAAGLFLLALIWLPLAWRGDRPDPRSDEGAPPEPRGQSGFARFMSLLTVIGAAFTLVWTVLVGHSGATATWGTILDEAPEPSPSPTSTPSPTTSPTASPTPTSTPSPTSSPTPTTSPTAESLLPEDELQPTQ